jgi:hypothetical protein
MSLAADRRPEPFARPALSQSTLTNMLAAGLLVAACAHITLAFEHGPSTFGILVAVAGTMQAVLAGSVLRRAAHATAYPAMLLSLVLIQLYVLNVTTGLPPAIAHTHVPGTHVLLGVTLAWPSTIDTQGLLAQLAQAVAVASGAVLQRGRPHFRTR